MKEVEAIAANVRGERGHSGLGSDAKEPCKLGLLNDFCGPQFPLGCTYVVARLPWKGEVSEI